MGEMKKVLITGANGFLGSHILIELLQEGHLPVLILRSTSDLWRISHLIGKCITYIIDQKRIDWSLIFSENDIDGIIHTATDYGRNSKYSDIIKTNVLFPLELIEDGILKGLKYFINTDSFFSKPMYQQSYLNQYTSSKRILENILIDMAGKLKVVNMRVEHVYGENDSEQKFVTTILKQLILGEDEILLTSGKQKSVSRVKI